MISAIRRYLCRRQHQGFFFNGIHCEKCLTPFRDRTEAGTLEEFVGRVKLDEFRILDEEERRFREFVVDGWRVTDSNGRTIKEWGSPPEKKVLKPIPISLVNRTGSGAGRK